MARIEETERTYDEDRVPKGEYIAFFAGFVPRDRDTMRPQFKEVDEYKDGQKTGDQIPAVYWHFEVISPAEHRGGDIPGRTPWKGFKVTKNQKGEAIVQVERVGQMLVNMVKWAEACGIDWQEALGDKLPDSGKISDQMLLEAVEQSLLDCARQGALVVVKTTDNGWVDTREQNDTCLMPLGTGPKAKAVEGIEYTVPDFYGTAAGLPPGAVEAGSWDEGYLGALRGFIRGDLAKLLTAGENVLTLEQARGSRLLAQAAQAGDYEDRARAFANGMSEGGYDAMDGPTLKRVVLMVTGLEITKGAAIVDALAPLQLEGAVGCLSAIAKGLGKDVPDGPVPPAPPKPGDVEDLPF